ncbi:MAG: FAD-dependent oxidoreductase [Chloroflexi bacterium]|nr:FAD-dependent oxidoreductase [Chloroflexota bacterium]MCI0860964.1 FAD-dependent oxidoreductase [Chloroflexota bacterium]MCI0875213.1 FAD-dependent oxidoreductase [Chloroflexota bacterium]
MKDQARVVIIGGGIAGCSIAYHLAKMGWTNVILVDKGELTSGSTFHAAGLVTQFHTSPTLMNMRLYSADLYRRLQAEHGEAVGWMEVGSLRLVSSPARLKQVQRGVSQANAIAVEIGIRTPESSGLELGILSPAEALSIFPEMSGEGLYGAMYIESDGYIDPNGITTTLAKLAREMGVGIHTGVLVTGIELTANREVSRVITDQGSIRTEYVVNAAGQWAPQVAAMVGATLPITPVIHQYLTTKPIPGHELPRQTPVLRDPDNLFYLREEVGGFLVGGFEQEPKVWSPEGVAWEFTNQLLPPDWDLFEQVMDGAQRRVPVLAKAQIIKLINGPEGITPDGHPCLGPLPGIRGFYAAAGLSHVGFGGGGAIGKVMAEWIIEGEPELDTHEFNVRRFGSVYADRAFSAERAREVYKYYYFLRYPEDENEWGRPQRVSPLDEHVKELGAVFGEKNGWERVNYYDPGQPWRRAGADQRAWGWARPPYFEQIGEEHRAVRERVAIFDMTSFGKIEVRGPGALRLLQKLTDNQLDKPVGRVTYTQFLNTRGGIESDLTVTRLGQDHFRVISGSAFVDRDLGWILLHAPQDGSIRVREVTEDLACIGLWGPDSRRVLQAVTSSDVSNESLPYMSAAWVDVNGAEILAQRVTYVGELGWELYTTHEQAVPVWEALMEAGQQFEIQPAGYKALDTLRLEKAYRYWSLDITPEENPYEAGLGFCVRLDKGEFIGREALIKAKDLGLRRRLCTLTVEGEPGVLYGGEAVYADGRMVGRLRSGGYGYTVGENIALAYLPPELCDQGTELQVEVFSEHRGAKVVPDVLYDPDRSRVVA